MSGITVGELKDRVFDHCDDQEPVHFYFDIVDMDGRKRTVEMDFSHATSTAGGRMTLMTFVPHRDTPARSTVPASSPAADSDPVRRKEQPECKGCPHIWGNSNCRVCQVWINAHRE